MQTQTFKCGENVINGAFLLTGRVYVINTKQPSALVRFGIQITGQCSEQRTKVQGAAGRGCKTTDIV